jgi:hypothetical protein
VYRSRTRRSIAASRARAKCVGGHAAFERRNSESASRRKASSASSPVAARGLEQQLPIERGQPFDELTPALASYAAGGAASGLEFVGHSIDQRVERRPDRTAAARRRSAA